VNKCNYGSSLLVSFDGKGGGEDGRLIEFLLTLSAPFPNKKAIKVNSFASSHIILLGEMSSDAGIPSLQLQNAIFLSSSQMKEAAGK